MDYNNRTNYAWPDDDDPEIADAMNNHGQPYDPAEDSDWRWEQLHEHLDPDDHADPYDFMDD